MSGYPPALRTVLKAVPSVLLLYAMTVLAQVVYVDVMGHPQDHVPRYNFRTERFEKSVRFRDERIRHYYKDAMLSNPNNAHESLV